MSFITANCVQKLKLPPSECRVPINGVGSQTVAISKGLIRCTLLSLSNPNFELKAQATILPQITTNLPNWSFSREICSDISSLHLADPHFNVSNPIDFLLGADLYPLILTHKPVITLRNGPAAIDTVFGKVLIGKLRQLPTSAVSLFASSERLQESMKQFWEIEKPSPSTIICSDDEFVEFHPLS